MKPLLEAATSADLPAIRALLEELKLPAADVGAPNQIFFAAHAGGALVGCVGVELYGESALLRSLAVKPVRQGEGMGRALTGRAIAEAKARGARRAFLLTTTAEDYCRRLGFERLGRDAVAPEVGASAQFKGLCPASAICMWKKIG
jgi:amino-acid N-acetyltransferase